MTGDQLSFNMVKLKLIGKLWFGLALAAPLALQACAGVGAPTTSSSSSFSLVAHSSRTVWISSGFRDLRVCNDEGSGGALRVAIGSEPSRLLPPGACTAGSGDAIDLENLSSGSVSGIYRTYSGPTFSNR
jgi:hypothetical protein